MVYLLRRLLNHYHTNITIGNRISTLIRTFIMRKCFHNNRGNSKEDHLQAVIYYRL